MNGTTDLAVAFRGIGALVVVLALVLIIGKLVKRAGDRRRTDEGLQIVQRVGLSKEASLAVVEIDGRTLVLGVTSHGVSMLSSLGEGAIDSDALTAALVQGAARAPALIVEEVQEEATAPDVVDAADDAAVAAPATFDEAVVAEAKALLESILAKDAAAGPAAPPAPPEPVLSVAEEDEREHVAGLANAMTAFAALASTGAPVPTPAPRADAWFTAKDVDDDDLDEEDDDEPDARPPFVPAPHIVLPRQPEPSSPRTQPRPERHRSLPTGIDLEAYPDLASALRAAGLTTSGGVPAARAAESPRLPRDLPPGTYQDASFEAAAMSVAAHSVEDVATAAAAWIATLPRTEIEQMMEEMPGSVMLDLISDLPTISFDEQVLDAGADTALTVTTVPAELGTPSEFETSSEPEFDLLVQEMAQGAQRAEQQEREQAEAAARAQADRIEALIQQEQDRLAEQAEREAEQARIEAETLAAAESQWRSHLAAARSLHETRHASLDEPATIDAPVCADDADAWEMLPGEGTSDPAAVAAKPAKEAKEAKRAPRHPSRGGSVLSPATWKQGVEALRDMTARKA